MQETELTVFWPVQLETWCYHLLKGRRQVGEEAVCSGTVLKLIKALIFGLQCILDVQVKYAQ